MVLWGSLCKISGPHLSADCDSANPATSRASWKCAVCAVGKGSFGEGTENSLESDPFGWLAHRLNDSREKRNLDLITASLLHSKLPWLPVAWGFWAVWDHGSMTTKIRLPARSTCRPAPSNASSKRGSYFQRSRRWSVWCLVGQRISCVDWSLETSGCQDWSLLLLMAVHIHSEALVAKQAKCSKRGPISP